MKPELIALIVQAREILDAQPVPDDAKVWPDSFEEDEDGS